jgi:hypothetical protein
MRVKRVMRKGKDEEKERKKLPCAMPIEAVPIEVCYTYANRSGLVMFTDN